MMAYDKKGRRRPLSRQGCPVKVGKSSAAQFADFPQWILAGAGVKRPQGIWMFRVFLRFCVFPGFLPDLLITSIDGNVSRECACRGGG
jgi:hypothetical protein